MITTELIKVAPSDLVPGQVYRITIPGKVYDRTGLVMALLWQGELCTERTTGHLEPVRCETADTYFTPATAEEAAHFETLSRW